MTQISTLKTESFSAQSIVYLNKKQFKDLITLATPLCIFYCKNLRTPQQVGKEVNTRNVQGVFYIIQEGTFMVTNANGTEEYQDFLNQSKSETGMNTKHQGEKLGSLEKIPLNLENTSPDELIRHIGDSLFKKSVDNSKNTYKTKKTINLEGTPAQILHKRQEIDQLLQELDNPDNDQSQEDILVKQIDALKAEIHHLLTNTS